MSNDKFEYNYSAGTQEEIEKIREKYMPAEETKLEQLKKIDRKVTQKANMVAILEGLVSTILLGIGMSMSLVWTQHLLILGTILGTVGIVGIALAYPIHNKVLKEERKKAAPEIIRLSDELLK